MRFEDEGKRWFSTISEETILAPPWEVEKPTSSQIMKAPSQIPVLQQVSGTRYKPSDDVDKKAGQPIIFRGCDYQNIENQALQTLEADISHSK